MSESDKPVVSAAVEATSEAVSTITTSSSPLDILKDINPVPVVEEMVEEFGKMQQGKNKPTIVRKLASEFRAHVDDLRIKYYELKNKIIDLSKETKSAPSKFVAETAVLHSAFLVKMCHHQPNLLIASVALGAALPTASKYYEHLLLMIYTCVLFIIQSVYIIVARCSDQQTLWLLQWSCGWCCWIWICSSYECFTAGFVDTYRICTQICECCNGKTCIQANDLSVYIVISIFLFWCVFFCSLCFVLYNYRRYSEHLNNS